MALGGREFQNSVRFRERARGVSVTEMGAWLPLSAFALNPVRATRRHGRRGHHWRTEDIMEQQHHVNRGLTALKPSVGTVISEGEWLAVSTEGFSEQQRGRPLAHLVKELVQKARLDSVGSAGRIDLEFRPKGPRTAFVRCADDGPGAEDLTRLNIVFVTGKKDGVTQRGRMGRG